MDQQTEELLVHLAKEHPIIVLLIAGMPGATAFIQAISALVRQAARAIGAWKGRNGPDNGD